MCRTGMWHVACAIICNVVTHDSDVALYSSNQPVLNINPATVKRQGTVKNHDRKAAINFNVIRKYRSKTRKYRSKHLHRKIWYSTKFEKFELLKLSKERSALQLNISSSFSWWYILHNHTFLLCHRMFWTEILFSGTDCRSITIFLSNER